MATCPCLRPQRSFCRRAVQYCDNGLPQAELLFFETTKIRIGRAPLRQILLQASRSTLRRRKIESDTASLRLRLLQAGHSTCRHDGTAVILDFRPKLANRCSQEAKTRAIRASIPDFKPRLENRCRQKVKTRAIRASILDFKPRLANRCSQKVKTGANRALILDFKPRLANRCIRVAHSWGQPHPPQADSDAETALSPQADSAAETLSTRHKKRVPTHR